MNIEVQKSSRRVAVVTGSAQGIGKAIAMRLIHDGCVVVIADRSRATQTAAELGEHAWGVEVDVSDPDQVEALMRATIERFGRIDVLVNNAGLYTSLTKKPFEEISADEWKKVFEVNVEGVWHCCKYAAAYMKAARTGAVVNISSASVAKGNAQLLHYVASKGAVQAMTRVLARELGEYGIRVNTVSPGFTLSDGVKATVAGREKQLQQVRESRVIQRDLEAEDIASAVAYLVREDAGMMTGQNLTVDGGMVMN